VKRETSEVDGLKDASEFKEQADSFDEMGPIAKDKFARDHNPIDL
jgi:hypothetical protein